MRLSVFTHICINAFTKGFREKIRTTPTVLMNDTKRKDPSPIGILFPMERKGFTVFNRIPTIRIGIQAKQEDGNEMASAECGSRRLARYVLVRRSKPGTARRNQRM